MQTLRHQVAGEMGAGGVKDDFNFKVGDIITGTTRYKGVPLLITAIGKRRFLFVNMSLNRDEQVAQKNNVGNLWIRWNKMNWPDEQYKYVLDRPKDKWGLL